jgi:hypothetical protein
VGKRRNGFFVDVTRNLPRALEFLTFLSITIDPQPQFFSHQVPWVRIQSINDRLSLFLGLLEVGDHR